MRGKYIGQSYLYLIKLDVKVSVDMAGGFAGKVTDKFLRFVNNID